jgi:hypothetical protein
VQHRATGNTAFGQQQGGNPQTGSANTEYGQSRAADVRNSAGSTNSQNGDKGKENDKGKSEDNDKHDQNSSPSPTP